jgi:flagellar biogenesis protein FliO
MSFGTVENISPLLLNFKLATTRTLFQMIGAFFAMFASDNEHIALMVNMTSVVSSAFTILFLFWSSSMILKKLISNNCTKSKGTKQLN